MEPEAVAGGRLEVLVDVPCERVGIPGHVHEVQRHLDEVQAQLVAHDRRPVRRPGPALHRETRVDAELRHRASLRVPIVRWVVRSRI